MNDDPKKFGLPEPRSPFAKEYREVTDGMQRCSRNGTQFDVAAYDPEAIVHVQAMRKAT